MPEEGGAQAPALRDRVNSGQRQKPVVGRRVELSHLLNHGLEVAEYLIAAAFGYQLPERCFIGFAAGGNPQADGTKVLKYVPWASIEAPPAICLGDLWPVGGVLICVRPG